MTSKEIVARAAVSVGFALMLAAAPGAALAEACFEANLRLECVKSKDIVGESLLAKDIKDESRAFFDLGGDNFGVPQDGAVYAQVVFTPPEGGSLVVRGSANISIFNGTEGTVECDLRVGRRSDSLRRLKPVRGEGPFRGSANDSSRTFGTIAFSTVLGVSQVARRKVGRPRKLALVCKSGAGSAMNLLKPAITVVFHPLRYFKSGKKK